MPPSVDGGIVVYGLHPGRRSSAKQPVSSHIGGAGAGGSLGTGDRGLCRSPGSAGSGFQQGRTTQ
ncbi:hypothetical protein APA43_27430, partial [Pseudomonas aeruginosa]